MSLIAITQVHSIYFGLATFVIIVVFCFLGYNRRLKRLRATSEKDLDISTVSAAMLGLLALLLSFTFSMAFSRYDARREVIVQEANNIGTAILRTELYPDSIGQLMRTEFKKYVDARIAYYDAGPDSKKLEDALKEANKYSSNIWKMVAIQAQNKDNLIRSNNMIPAMNAVIDIVTTREKLRKAYIPDPVMVVLFLLIAICSLLLGFTNKVKGTLVTVAFGFALIISITIFLIIDLVQSTRGFITQYEAQQSIIDLKSLFP